MVFIHWGGVFSKNADHAPCSYLINKIEIEIEKKKKKNPVEESIRACHIHTYVRTNSKTPLRRLRTTKQKYVRTQGPWMYVSK